MADLTTLAKARQQLFGNDPAIEADTLLGQLITSSSAWIEREVGGDLMTANITETFDGDGGTVLRLTRCHTWRPGSPAPTITSVHVDGVAIAARASVTSVNTNPSGYIFRDDRIELVGYTFTVGVKNVTVVYTAGYTVCPTDLEQACLEHIALRFKDRGHIGVELVSGGGEGMVNYGNAGTMAYIENVLSFYRVMGFM
jgi:hypothetical protein